MGVVFRAPGDNAVTCDHRHIVAQTVEAHVGGGQRSTMAAWVPVRSGEIEWCWFRNTAGNWPDNPAYGVNLFLQAWVR
jgi:hypothetical protein